MTALLCYDEDWRRGLEQDCRLCTADEYRGHRAEWGCDHEVPPLFFIKCFRCEGDARAMPLCKTCAGKGELPIDRCPWTYAGRWERAVCLHADQLAQGGDPMSGTVRGDWPAHYEEALMLASRELAAAKERRMEKAQQEAKRKSKRR